MAATTNKIALSRGRIDHITRSLMSFARGRQQYTYSSCNNAGPSGYGIALGHRNVHPNPNRPSCSLSHISTSFPFPSTFPSPPFPSSWNRTSTHHGTH